MRGFDEGWRKRPLKSWGAETNAAVFAGVDVERNGREGGRRLGRKGQGLVGMAVRRDGAPETKSG